MQPDSCSIHLFIFSIGFLGYLSSILVSVKFIFTQSYSVVFYANYFMCMCICAHVPRF